MLLERKLREKGEELSVEKWIKLTVVKSALKSENLTANQFFQEIGLQKRPLQQFLRKYKLLHFESSGRLKEMIRPEFWGNVFGADKNIFLIDDVQNPLIRLANCCFPIPGDKISGFIYDDKEIEIHLLGCLKIIKNKKMTQSRIIPIDVSWNISKKISRSHVIHLHVIDGTGILFQITKVIKDAGVAIINSESAGKNKKEADIRIKLESVSWPVFHKIVEKLRPLKFVKKIWEEPPQEA